jgi:hypothetical protein
LYSKVFSLPFASMIPKVRPVPLLSERLQTMTSRSSAVVRGILVAGCFVGVYRSLAFGAQTIPTPTYAYTFSPAVATGSPRIIKVELNSDHLHAGEPIAIRVTTTPDVTEVVTGHGKHNGALTPSGAGVFTSESTLPRLGGLATVRISLHFVGTTASGQSTSVDVPVHYR